MRRQSECQWRRGDTVAKYKIKYLLQLSTDIRGYIIRHGLKQTITVTGWDRKAPEEHYEVQLL